MPIRLADIPNLQPAPVQAPQVSTAAAAAPGRALGSVAQGIAQVGQAFDQHAERIQGFENARMESETRQKWMAGASQLQLENDQDPDPANHLKRTDEFLQAQKATLDQPDLAPEVRERLVLQFDDFAGRVRNRGAETAAALSARRSTLALNNEVEAGITAGNPSAVERAVRTGLETGVLLPEQGDKILRDSTTAIRRNQLLTQAAQDPVSILDGTKPEDVNDLEWLDIQATARRANAQETSTAADQILDGIITGNITDPQQIDELTPGLRPAAKESLKRHLADRADETTRALKASPAYQASAVAKVQEMLNDFTVDTDGYDEAYVEMARIVRDLPPGAVRDELSRNLEQSRSGQVKVIETAADYHRQSLTDLHAAGAFGTGTKDQPVDKILADGILRDPAKLQRRGFTAEQAAQIAAAPTDPERVVLFRELSKQRAGFDQSTEYERAALDAIQKGDTGLVTVPDMAAKEKARRAYGLAKTKLEDWLKRNPNATEEQGREALLRITGETAIPGMVDQILEAPPALDAGMVLPPKPQD